MLAVRQCFSSILRKRYETTPLFSKLAAAADMFFMPRPPGLRGGQKPSGPTIKYDALFMVKSSIVYNLDSAAEGAVTLPARTPSARAAPYIRRLFHFIQINFKRCNVCWFR